MQVGGVGVGGGGGGGGEERDRREACPSHDTTDYRVMNNTNPVIRMTNLETFLRKSFLRNTHMTLL